MFMYANSGQNKLNVTKKNRLTPIFIREKNLVSRKFMCTCSKHNCFHKKSCTNIEIVSKGNNKKESCFCSLVYEKNLSHFGITIFWLGGEKLHHQKWKNCVVFPKSRYSNLYPGKAINRILSPTLNSKFMLFCQ